jgi:hypothetical protein
MTRADRVATTLGAAVILLVGCATPIETSSPTSPPSPAGSPSLAASESANPEPSSVAPIVVPMAGHPYDAAAILEAMRESVRPGGVPAAVQTFEIAGAIAGQIWTLGGEPWDAIAIGGSCGPASCTLDVTGAKAGGDEVDAWIFGVTPEGAVERLDADLHLVPNGAGATLDALARAGSAELDGLLLASVRWAPPPDPMQFVLAYRAGDEEGSCARDVTLDADGQLIGVESVDC